MAKKQTQFFKRRAKRVRRRAKLLLTPQRDNHYRPYLVRRIPLLIVVALVAVVQLSYNFSSTGDVLGRASSVTPEGLLIATNDQRSAEQRSHLRKSDRLSEAARHKANDMLKQNYWAHNAPDGTEPWVWIDREGYSYSVAGENLAKNFSTSRATVAAWMASASHRENMLNPDYQDVGFAVVDGVLDGEDTSLVVAFYAKPADWRTLGEVEASSPVVHESSASVALTPADKVGIAMQSLTPASLTSLVLIFIALTVAITAHFYRSKLPKQRRESWHRHHGWLKAGGLMAIAVLIVLFYSGGQL